MLLTSLQTLVTKLYGFRKRILIVPVFMTKGEPGYPGIPGPAGPKGSKGIEGERELLGYFLTW